MLFIKSVTEIEMRSKIKLMLISAGTFWFIGLEGTTLKTAGLSSILLIIDKLFFTKTLVVLWSIDSFSKIMPFINLPTKFFIGNLVLATIAASAAAENTLDFSEGFVAGADFMLVKIIVQPNRDR